MNRTDKILRTSFPLSNMLVVLFVALKVTGNSTMSWWWVFSPWWISVLIVFSVLLLIGLFILVFQSNN